MLTPAEEPMIGINQKFKGSRLVFRVVFGIVTYCRLTSLHAENLTPGSEGASPEFSSEQLEFFETSVRPLLISACGECHGEKKQWAGLRLDSRQSILSGGDTGPAIVPGEPDQSLLISAVRRTGDYEMPPEKPLSAEQVAILEKWVQLGAPWPKEVRSHSTHEEHLKTHWAFQPVGQFTPPESGRADRVRTPVDNFILAKLQEASLSMSPQADRATLIRRLTYDLTGLPPTKEAVDAFVNDSDPQAYQKLVEQLLESPRYGEHWGRKWLDLARYSDTKGYMFGWEINRFVHSSVYRDWVIKAFNDDLPYDQFLKLQIAADQIAADDPASQVAMGFLTLGRRFLGNDHDIIDDRIDVIGRTTMGLTIGCARCHDHKYDPIPTADYYSMYGVLGNSVEQIVPACSLEETATPEFLAELKKRQQLFDEALPKYRKKVADRMRSRISDYLAAQLKLGDYPNIPFSQIIAVEDLFPVYVHSLNAYLRRTQLNQNPVFVPWHQFESLPAEDFAAKAVQVTESLRTSEQSRVNPLVLGLFEVPPTSMQEVAERYGSLLSTIRQEWEAELAAAKEAGTPPPERFQDESREQLRLVLYGDDSPCEVPNEHLTSIGPYFATRSELEEIWKFQREIESYLLDGPNAPPFALRMVDRKLIEEPRIFRRGNPAVKGDEVPRQLPLIIGGSQRQPFQGGSGRRELAEGIVDPDNPLTARVWVNRIWQHHFGTGLVPTPSDFGTRAPRPEHLELLDWLATQLIKNGWSTKSIHRLILLSSTYQQQSTGPADIAVLHRAENVDPENRLLWKMNSHRLTFEEVRDSMLAVSGELDLTAGGRGSTLFASPDGPQRRTVYGFIDREHLPDVFRVFDFANPDLHLPERSETTVPQQALFALNHPFVAARAKHLAGLIESINGDDQTEKVTALFETVLQRGPTASQREAALRFLATSELEEQPTMSPEQLAWQYGYGAVNSSGTGVETFTPLPYFNGHAWQGGAQFPDAALGWAQLTAEGGHPGNDHQHAVIRRWTAPQDGVVAVESIIKHEVANGNGIRCWIISSRSGLLNQSLLHNSSQSTTIESVQVQAGETLDFVVDVNGQLNNDQYLWTVSIHEKLVTAGAANDVSAGKNWNSKRDFIGPSTGLLKPWEQLAQVLLLSNEFLFVD
ncbi:PSD1 and planctomycete cytochrome C domain-containing protein [Planctomicrobium sp. SH661]|uniref:PSD1 and planctomycete cytochrome C domain-containing protein n=1 Tax=Planctomicrobium sp. SH661 TaxID=3448124 RepID=UPI003F5C0F06